MGIHNKDLKYENMEQVVKARVRDAQYRGAFRLTALCLGLMCLLQATLNIVLRLHFTETLQSNYTRLGEVRDQLQREKDELQEWLFNLSTAEDIRMGWVRFGFSLYNMSTEHKNWTQSRDDCAKKNANLVIITSREEQKFIEMLRKTNAVWIGLSKQNTEGLWKWVDGTPLKTTFWWTQEPNNFTGDEHCVETGYSPNNGRPVVDDLKTWNDNTCSAKIFSICEKTISI